MKIGKNSGNFSFRGDSSQKNPVRVGFFDSGMGGLTVLSDCVKLGVRGELYYYGDNARAPYGNLPPTTVRRYAFEAFKVFEELKVDAVVVACNTVTALCIDELRERYSFPIIGVEPAVMLAAKNCRQVFVLVTRATLESTRFNILCARTRKKFPDCNILPFACDHLAGEIEKGLLSKERRGFSEFFPVDKTGRTPDGVVLGCTHYNFLRSEISAHYSCPVYDGNAGVAKRLLSVLTLDRPFLTTRFAVRPPSTTFCSPQDVLLLKTEGGELFQGALTEQEEKNAGVIGGSVTVYFLGSGRKINKSGYEQMFVNGF